ncbi:tripeptidyl aminopeptidase [Streptomyces badius]
MRRTTVLGSAGALVAGTLIAGAMAAPAASAGGRHPGRGDAEARGVAVAAQRAAKAGIDWKDCPKDWG